MKMEKLTVSLTVVVAASVRPLKARLMTAAIWREREGAGEGEIRSNQDQYAKLALPTGAGEHGGASGHVGNEVQGAGGVDC